MFKTFEGYKFDNVDISESITLEDIKNAEFVNRKENLILYGAVGTGNYRKFLFMERNKRT